jgi:YebC/PmpR family DNA-binding regulatory protein
MAGHSKWANIKFRKAAQDAKRGKIFTKLIREITIAARMSGPDLDSNPRLRDAVTKALKSNMKRDTVDNAIKRGAGGLDGDNMAELRYEGYGPGGVAVLVDCLTDNKNRTVSEVRHAFTKCGGNLGTDGSVAYLFTKKGEILFDKTEKTLDEDAIFEAAIEANAEDVNSDEQSIQVFTVPENFEAVRRALEKFSPDQSEWVMEPSIRVPLEKEQAEQLLRLVDMLEDLDDVQTVHTNADISQEVLEALG